MDELCQALEQLSVESPESHKPVFDIRNGVEMLINMNRNANQENAHLKEENAILKIRIKLILEALDSVKENHVPIWVK
tara:strand:+ start:399 stop:632 length:234 start_codon:yes stop_codon:yes gene_type:complete